MNRQTPFLLIVFIALFLVLLTAGCEQTTEEAAIVEAAATEVEVPKAIGRAQEAVLRFLRTSANHCVPPEGVEWTVSDRADMTPAGFGAYRFTADNCMITVSYPLTAEPEAYHVSLSNAVTGFCWQAVVDDHGQILRTGVAAESEDAAGNPAATYCRQQGYSYEIRMTENGQKCGACVFPDGSACKAWDFFHGDCGPGDNPPEDEN